MTHCLQTMAATLAIAAATLCSACEGAAGDETPISGTGGPMPQNVMNPQWAGGYNCQYTKNAIGLVTEIYRLEKTGSDGSPTYEKHTIATISYPSRDRAVMVYTDDINFSTTYDFMFGDSQFAQKIVEKDSDGETYVTACEYDSEGHLTKFNEGYGDCLELTWTDGNITRIKQHEGNATATLTYTSLTDFQKYGHCPFLTDVRFSNIYSLSWWFDRGYNYALYLGFLGRPCRNLPATMTESGSTCTFDYSGNSSWQS